MRRQWLALAAALGALACGGANPLAGGGTRETVAMPADPVLAKLTRDDVRVIDRYLRAHPRWDVSELSGGVRYAFRREKPKKPPIYSEGAPTPHPDGILPGGYDGGSNGFISDRDSTDVTQTRVVLSLGKEYGMGSRKVTRVKADAPTASVITGKFMDEPGLESYLIVEGAQGVTLEVYEQSNVSKRAFTEQALREVDDELRAVLAARDTIEKDGWAPALFADAPLKSGKPRMIVEDGMQPGMYVITAWLNPGADGRVYARVHFMGPDPQVGPSGVPSQEITAVGQELSGDRVRPRTLRYVGWGADPKVLFAYQSGVMVYEGGWNDSYVARFELWHDDVTGKQTKLVESTRTISGWER